MTNGQSARTIAEAQIDHNTTIVNSNNGKVTMAAAVAEISYNSYGRVQIWNNYTDPTGSHQCFITTGHARYQTEPVSGITLEHA